MSSAKKNKPRKNYAVAGKPMSKKEFAEMIKTSEESGSMDWKEAKKKLSKRIAAYSKLLK